MPGLWCSPFQLKLWKSWGFKVATKLFSQAPEYDVSSFHVKLSITVRVNYR